MLPTLPIDVFFLGNFGHKARYRIYLSTATSLIVLKHDADITLP